MDSRKYTPTPQNQVRHEIETYVEGTVDSESSFLNLTSNPCNSNEVRIHNTLTHFETFV